MFSDTWPQTRPWLLHEGEQWRGMLFCGNDCEKTGTNEFIVPTKEFSLEEPVSVYFFWTHRFFRLFVEHINRNTGVVTLNAFLWHAEMAEERT